MASSTRVFAEADGGWVFREWAPNADAISLVEQDGISGHGCSTLRLGYQGASVPVG